MSTAPALREREVTVAGVRSPVIEAGPPDATQAAVFVHGNPGSGRDWEALVRAVGEHGRAVAPDMPGFGRADKPDGFDHTVPGYARHLDGVLHELRIERAHLVLHDFGGPWGLWWAREHRDRVGSLTLINTGVLLGYRWHALARIWRTPGVGETFQAGASRSAFKLLMRRGQRRRPLPEPFLDQMYDNYDRGTRRAVLRLYRATDAGALGDEAREGLRGLDVPVNVVWGARDPYIGVEQAHRQKEVFPQAEVTLLEDSGHWPFADDPEGTATAAVPFLARRLQ